MRKFLSVYLFLVYSVITINLSAQTSWHIEPNYPGLGRCKSATFVIGHYIYVCCGQQNSSTTSQTSDCWRFDTHTNTWSSIASYPGGGSYSCASFSYQNYGYLLCGWNGSNETNDMWRYDTITNSWSAMANFPGVARDGPFALVYGTKVVVGCGSVNSPPYLSDVYEYDILANTWVRKNNFPVGKAGEIYLKIGNGGYVGSGGPGGPIVNDFWKYNPTTDSWTAMAPIPSAGAGLDQSTEFVIGGYGYVGTGLDGTGNIMGHFWRYDTLTNSWCQIQDLTGSPRYYDAAQGQTVENKGYILCGFNPSGVPLDDFWQYYPEPGFTVSDTNICPGQQVSFTDTTDFSPTFWDWTFQNGNPGTSNTQNPAATYTASGTYSVTLIVGNSCIVDTVNKVVNVTVSPLAVTIGGNYSICNGSADTITVTGGTSYLWSNGSTSSSIILTAADSGTYSVTVSKGACTLDTSVTINTKPVVTTAGEQTVCSGSDVELIASGGGTYKWIPSAGLSCPTCDSTSAVVSSSMVYTVVVTKNGCSDTNYEPVTIVAAPTVSACCSTTIPYGDSIQLTATASGVVSYIWAPEGSMKCDSCPSITVTPGSSTTYTVTVKSPDGCTASDTVYVGIEGCENIWIPNAFTPNHDGLNDVFGPKGSCLVSYSMYIFDRWGSQVYHSDNATAWDGKVTGGTIVAQEDTYVYEVIATFAENRQKTIIGRVTLLH